MRPIGLPSAPTGVTATAGDGFVDLSWTAPTSDGGAAVDSYTLTSSPGGIQCTTTGATNCRIDSLTAGIKYTFTAVAHNLAGTGPKSARSAPITVVGRPAKPSLTKVKPADHVIRASWAAPANGGSPILSYTVTAQPGGKICTTSKLSCVITDLDNGTAYTLTLVAANAVGDSPQSDPSEVATPFGKPAQVTKPTASPLPESASVTWDAPSSNGSPITKYTVTSSPSGKTCTTSTATTCVVPGLTNGRAYSFTVKATNAAGDSAASEPSNATTPLATPGPPGRPSATTIGRTATISWTAPKPIKRSAAITGYQVTSSPGNLTCQTDGNLTCEVSHLTAGKTYTFTAQALSSVGPGPASRVSNAITPRTVPDPPTGVTARPGRTRATVTWTAPADTGGLPLTGYTVFTEPGDAPQRVVRGTLATITGLEVGKSYTFKVVATNAKGDSDSSDSTDPVEIVPVVAPPFGPGFWLGVDEPDASNPGPNTGAWAEMLAQTQSQVYREQFIWYRIAPTKPASPTNPADPAYNWTKMDTFARLSQTVGAEPLVNFYGAPAWAEGPRRAKDAATGSWKPDPAALRDFGVAMATRYSGDYADPLHPGSKLPRIRMFEAWNEPNYKYFLQPQFETIKRKRTLTLVDRYRTMLNSFYDGVKSVQPTSMILTSGLGPYGRSSAGVEIQPQSFLKNLLCIGGISGLLTDTSCPVKAKFDAVAIHPYTLQGKPTDKAHDPNGGGLGNTPDFASEIAAAVKFDNVSPAGPKNLIATEFVWLTNPPGRVTTTGPTLGIEPTLAAQYTSETVYRLFRWGVTGAVWYGLRDRTPTWPGGLFFAGKTVASSTPKPGLTAFITPLFVSFTDTGARYWAISHCLGPRATVTFQGKVGRTWETQVNATPGGDGVAQQTAARPRNITTFRAVASDNTGCTSTSVEMPAGTG